MPLPKINKRTDNNEWNKVNKFSAAFDFALCHRQAFGGHLFPEDWLHAILQKRSLTLGSFIAGPIYINNKYPNYLKELKYETSN